MAQYGSESGVHPPSANLLVCLRIERRETNNDEWAHECLRRCLIPSAVLRTTNHACLELFA